MAMWSYKLASQKNLSKTDSINIEKVSPQKITWKLLLVTIFGDSKKEEKTMKSPGSSYPKQNPMPPQLRPVTCVIGKFIILFIIATLKLL